MKRPVKTASRSRARAVPKRKSVGALVLDADCLIDSADALKAALLKRVKQRASVSIDVSRVQRIDTASLQVLAAFARDRAAAELAVEWAGVSDAFAESARLLNLTAVLGLAEAKAVAA